MLLWYLVLKSFGQVVHLLAQTTLVYGVILVEYMVLYGVSLIVQQRLQNFVAQSFEEVQKHVWHLIHPCVGYQHQAWHQTGSCCLKMAHVPLVKDNAMQLPAKDSVRRASVFLFLRS